MYNRPDSYKVVDDQKGVPAGFIKVVVNGEIFLSKSMGSLSVTPTLQNGKALDGDQANPTLSNRNLRPGGRPFAMK